MENNLKLGVEEKPQEGVEHAGFGILLFFGGFFFFVCFLQWLSSLQFPLPMQVHGCDAFSSVFSSPLSHPDALAPFYSGFLWESSELHSLATCCGKGWGHEYNLGF